ncbi:hypothetical protein [Dyadobacter aurulentus]|uniref:hypothetical protein n=1 Tax=Dyadobacter sp. UC 10 TaxID=2605428 RepID=UPI0011F39569|nr:hypothetical protein [Dyadobacter sp. UC 10]KAA0989160.1 hypothetical protein FXO21_02760 [Dyadobacter sp. UC 10]
MNNRLNFLVRKNKGKELMPEYESELRSLLISPVFDILTLEETDAITERIRQRDLGRNEKKILRIPFQDKSALKRFCLAIEKNDSSKVFISLGYTEFCGIASVNDIRQFNPEFSYQDEHSGLIVLYSEDLNNRLIIDFYAENDLYFYDMEIGGRRWTNFDSFNT